MNENCATFLKDIINEKLYKVILLLEKINDEF